MVEVSKGAFVAEVALTEIDGDARVRDVDLAERLGFERPRAIRQIIERNLSEVEALGVAPRGVAQQTRGDRGGTQEVTEYWLNEEQALLVSILSKAPNAPAVRASPVQRSLSAFTMLNFQTRRGRPSQKAPTSPVT